MAGKIESREIRIFVSGGVVQSIAVGCDVSADIKVSVADGDIDHRKDNGIEDNGYGEPCAFGCRTDIESPHRDEDGVVWL